MIGSLRNIRIFEIVDMEGENVDKEGIVVLLRQVLWTQVSPVIRNSWISLTCINMFFF